ncbi:hypothetical protein CDAR_456951 [Caerostris darwini]|uniref:Uncharacterized protein n=1 Tax=Caerostris darwini TaxID=1538125 RepID=A0AAV4T4Q7_9ARAC|nr:hypothetical protein CDAR_456951 [Caerostris darwini]
MMGGIFGACGRGGSGSIRLSRFMNLLDVETGLEEKKGKIQEVLPCGDDMRFCFQHRIAFLRISVIPGVSEEDFRLRHIWYEASLLDHLKVHFECFAASCTLQRVIEQVCHCAWETPAVASLEKSANYPP